MAKKTFKDLKIEREDKIVEFYAGLIFRGLTNAVAAETTMNRFNIYSRSTLWAIKKRVAKRMETQK